MDAVMKCGLDPPHPVDLVDPLHAPDALLLTGWPDQMEGGK